jgi:zinc transporter ZupT
VRGLQGGAAVSFLLAVWALTTAIAAAAAVSADYAPLQRKMMPWTAGILLGIGAFWILPEMAQSGGWAPAASAVTGTLVALGLFDRYVYPICPFCAAGVHSNAECDPTAHRRTLTLTWPLLLFGCLHVFLDGWTIALGHAAAGVNSGQALAWGVTVHKIPESLAIGMLAAQLTATRRAALGAVAVVQLVMAGGGVLALALGKADQSWIEFSAAPACAFLLLFGLLTLEQEWRAHGVAAAMKAAAPGLLGCGAVALTAAVVR